MLVNLCRSAWLQRNTAALSVLGHKSVPARGYPGNRCDTHGTVCRIASMALRPWSALEPDGWQTGFFIWNQPEKDAAYYRTVP